MAAQDQSSRTGVSIAVSGLTKTYKTLGAEVKALKSIDWKAEPGKPAILMGPSGCGKTTLLNLLAGIDYPSEGTVVVNGQNLARLSERELEKYRLLQVGYIFQFFNLIPTLSGLENLEIPLVIAGVSRKERLERCQRLLEMVGMGDKGHKRPEELSGGEQQRVAICLALVNDPPLILADEPTGNLDTENGKLIIDLLSSLSTEQGKTVVIASHDPKVFERFPEIYQMRDGVLVDGDSEG